MSPTSPRSSRKSPAATAAPATPAAAAHPGSEGPYTLAIDVGGSGLKASVLDAAGRMLTDRARIPTPYPITPAVLVQSLKGLVAPLPASDRVSVGFPGVVRRGRILTAPNLSRPDGPDSPISPQLVNQWSGFDLAGALTGELGKPTRVLNDADLQGLDVMTGEGIEVVGTLGTGFGTAVFDRGRLSAHLELAHHPIRDNETYDEYIGDAARKRIGNKKWNKRVARAIETLNTLFLYDHLYLGGGNTKHLTFDLPDRVTLIDPNAGILGGLRLWQLDIDN